MNNRHSFEGMGVAMVTPFCPDGSIDTDSLIRIVDHLIAGHADFLVVHGTTGESPCLTRDERNMVTQLVVERVAGRTPIMIGLGGNNTLETGQRIKDLDTTGIGGILSVVPYYNKPTQEGLFRHFSYLAERSSLPIVLYNIPGRSGINMVPETVARLAHTHSNIIGIKEASGFVAQVAQTKQLVERDDFTILSGDDALSVPFIQSGARGVISVVGNAYPELFAKLIHLSMAGQHNEADMIQAELRDLNTQLFANGNPAGIKALLYQMGVIAHNELRLPLIPATQEVYEALANARASVDAYIHASQDPCAHCD